MSRVIGVIPARLGSTRLPRKVLLPLHGKPLIQWVAEGVMKAKNLDAVLVATDDDSVRDVLEPVGVQVVMTRADHPSGTDRIAEAVADVDCDAVINVQGDEPMISPDLIDQLAEVIVDSDVEMATAITPIQTEDERDNPNVVKVVLNAKGEAMYFSRSTIPYIRESEDIPGTPYWRHIGMYAYKTDFLRSLVTHPMSELERVERLEQLRALQLGARIQTVVANEVGLGVDCEEDLKRVEQAMTDEGWV